MVAEKLGSSILHGFQEHLYCNHEPIDVCYVDQPKNPKTIKWHNPQIHFNFKLNII